MKIFVSYSRRDADFAQQIDEYFQDSGFDVFTDVKNIQAGVVWTSAIESNISNCDIFVVIITHASLRSAEVEKEVLQAQRENKKIIPCIHKDVSYNEIKWNLQSIQGVEFHDKYELSRLLYSKIAGKKTDYPPPPRPQDDYLAKRQGSSLKIILPIVAVAVVTFIFDLITRGYPGIFMFIGGLIIGIILIFSNRINPLLPARSMYIIGSIVIIISTLVYLYFLIGFLTNV